MKLFDRLVKENAVVWDAYLHHDFVKQIESGTLPKANFHFYLKQDYMYLLHYGRVCGLLANAATNAVELAFATKYQNIATSVVDGEHILHRSILSEKDAKEASKLKIREESIANIAYTCYMVNVASSGDFLDILVALSSCASGYCHIGREIYARLGEKGLKNHPYESWIRTYSDEVLAPLGAEFEDFVNSYTDSVSEAKFERLSDIFHTVTRLECNFWQQGLTMQMDL